jgi:hypothetical protein
VFGKSLISPSRVEQDDFGPRGPQRATVDAIRRVYEEKGIVFIPENGGGPGVRLTFNRREVKAIDNS